MHSRCMSDFARNPLLHALTFPWQDMHRIHYKMHSESTLGFIQNLWRSALETFVRMHVGAMSECTRTPYRVALILHPRMHSEFMAECTQPSSMYAYMIYIIMHTESTVHHNASGSMLEFILETYQSACSSCQNAVRSHARVHPEFVFECSQKPC